jgi:ribulose-5-phosphate 4-epimerase/fuculose-1-phosphate aldolase
MPNGQMSKVIQRLRTTLQWRQDPDLTDGQLLAFFIGRRDEDAFQALLRRHGPMVWGKRAP